MSASWRSQRGTASMEAMFVFPILMFGFFFLQKAAGIMATQEHAAVSVRTAAWSHALHRGYEDPILPSISGLGVALDLCDKAVFDGTTDGTFDVSCDLDGAADRGHGARFRKEVEGLGSVTASNDVRDAAYDLTRDIDKATPPLFSRATADVGFTPIRPALTGGGIQWSIHHTVGANQSWQLKDLPKGYDEQLKARLQGNDNDTAEELYADLF